MSKKASFYPKGVCSQYYEITLSDDNVIEDIQIQGGCNGNLKGLRSLMIGRPAEEIIDSLEGTTCGFKNTSCPDQIAKALKQMIQK